MQDFVIAFNRGDGADTVVLANASRNTISFGSGIAYADLSLSRHGNDLVLDLDEGDAITFKDWYATKSQRAVQLQFLKQGARDFDPKSRDKSRTHLVETFDFAKLAASFDDKHGKGHDLPLLTPARVSDDLLRAYLGGNNRIALGGELAEQYARLGDIGPMSLDTVQGALGAPGFANVPQLLRRPSAGANRMHLP